MTLICSIIYSIVNDYQQLGQNIKNSKESTLILKKSKFANLGFLNWYSARKKIYQRHKFLPACLWRHLRSASLPLNDQIQKIKKKKLKKSKTAKSWNREGGKTKLGERYRAGRWGKRSGRRDERADLWRAYSVSGCSAEHQKRSTLEFGWRRGEMDLIPILKRTNGKRSDGWIDQLDGSDG